MIWYLNAMISLRMSETSIFVVFIAWVCTCSFSEVLTEKLWFHISNARTTKYYIGKPVIRFHSTSKLLRYTVINFNRAIFGAGHSRLLSRHSRQGYNSENVTGYWETFSKIDPAMLVSPAPFKTYKSDGRGVRKNRESTSLFAYEMYGEGSAPEELGR